MFQIPVLKAGNGLTVRGLVSVAKQLVRQSETPELKGIYIFIFQSDKWVTCRVYIPFLKLNTARK